MACLAPQFKWAPSPSAHAPSSSSSSKCSALRVHCAVTSAVVDADRVNGGGAPLRLVYASLDVAPALQRNFESTLASEAHLNEEAVVAAAATEAVALARAAAEASREVVRMVQNNNEQPVVRQKKGVDNYLANEILRTEMESSIPNEYVNDVLLEDIEAYSIMGDEGVLDNDAQHTENIAVKSARQSERRARRTRAAIKAATTVRASQKSATSSKKKRSKGSSSSMNPLGSLWKMTGRRLLTAKEEVEFSEGIQDLLKLEAIQSELTEYNGGQPTFSQWAAAAGIDEKTLRKRLDHGIYCKNRMVTSNVRLVISIAREFEGPGMDLYDLIQEGMQGLIRGAEKFDASKGFRFSTYSHWWIKQAMRKSVSEQSQIFRLPAHMVEASYRVKECTRRLRCKLKRRPTNEEIAVDTGMPVKRVEAAVNLPKYSVSLDSKIGSTDMTYQEVTADPSIETAEEMLNRMSIKKDVHKALDTLTAREKQVVVLRFGLEDGRIRTLQEIGNIMGVSRERIRQIESGAFRKLRSKKRLTALKDYLVPVGNW
ncbi:RNA polymerase sigma factor sigB [Phragmites australis]|uniref:RNA polymerase sigma factor sigB n=1 Tax=Phragmites australis TaxID=29695 RepID=UPI002D772963|nr:RNA polymerase sigma factor sigB [Phragmites australis]